MDRSPAHPTRPVSPWTLLLAATLCAASPATTRADERHDTLPTTGRHAFHARIAGTCTNKDDFSFTGAAPGFFPGGAFRIHCVLAGDSTLGRYTAQALAELQVTADACTVPGASGLEATVEGFVLVITLNSTQEQLFLTLKDGSECLTPPGTRGPGRVTMTVTGGTGRFEGATGTLVNHIAPIALAFSALGGDGFLSAFSGTIEGPIRLR